MLHLRHCHLAASALLAALALLPGCASIGPGRMLQDRADYNSSLTESWKRQILLNIVKVRYVEPLFFMDFGDTVSVKEHLYKKQCDYIRIHSRFEQH